MQASVTASLMSASAWSGTSSASPKPPSACRTTATFSGRDGSVSSRSGVTGSAVTSRSGVLPASSAVVPTEISFHSRRNLGRRSLVLQYTEQHPWRHRPAWTVRYASRSFPRPPRRRITGAFHALAQPAATGRRPLRPSLRARRAAASAMVARLDNQPTHEVVDRALDGAGQPRAPRRRGRRHPHRRRRRDPRPDARRVPARGRRRSSCRRWATTASSVLPADRRRGARRSSSCSS